MPSLHTWNIKKIILSSDYNSFKHKQVLNNLYWRQDGWVAAVYDNECYPGAVAEVIWTLAYIIDQLSCF